MFPSMLSYARTLFIRIIKFFTTNAPAHLDKISKILLFGYGGIGDQVMFLPVMVSLRRKYPDARIEYVSKMNNPFVDFLKPYGLVDQYRNPKLGFSYFLKTLFQRSDYCLCVMDLHFPSIWLLPLIMNIPVRAGMTSGEGYQFHFDSLLNRSVACREKEHTFDRTGRLLDALDLPRPKWPPEEIQCHSQPPEPDSSPSVVLQPLSFKEQSWKRWPMERYVELCKRLDEQIIVVGSNEEKAELAQAFGDYAKIVAGQSLAALSRTLCQASLVIGNDSGIVHLAALLQRPAIVLFGPTDETLTSPRGERISMILASCDERPCFQFLKKDETNACALKNCMHTISVEVVYQEAKKVLANAPA